MSSENQTDLSSKTLKDLRLGIIMGCLGIGFLAFALPIYAKKLGLDALQIGGLFSIYSIGTLVLRPGMGWAMDRFGRKTFLVASLAFFAISMLVFTFSTGVIGLYGARILQAIGGAIFWISAYTIAIDLSDGSDKGKKVGTIDESFSRGTFVGGGIGFATLGLLSPDIAWQVLFILYAVIGFASCYMVWSRIPETKPKVAAGAPKSSIVINRELYKPIFIIFINTVAISSTSIMSSPLPMLLLQDKFTSNIFALGAVYIPMSILLSILPSRLGKVSDRVGRVLPICSGLVIIAICAWCISIADNFYTLLLLWAVEAGGFCLMSPAQAVLLTDKVGKTSTGATYGLFTFITSLGRIIGPLLGGWLYTHYGMQTPFFVNGCVIFSIAVLAFFLLDKENPIKVSPEEESIGN